MDTIIYASTALGLLVCGLAVIAFPYVLVQLLREAYREVKQLVVVHRALRGLRRSSADMQEHVKRERQRQRIQTIRDGEP